jgi:uncharacterized protein YndB with AHSA1/START domain
MGSLLNHEIHLEETFPAPPDELWCAFTEPYLLKSWLMDSDFKAEKGHEFTFRSKPMPGWEGVVHCRVLKTLPNKQLSYTWKGGKGMPETIVTWNLQPVVKGTRVTLTHTGFRGAWSAIVGRLILEPGWKRMVREALPKTLAEHCGTSSTTSTG